MKNIKTKKAGFSLVELMVVVAIIGILASIAVPNFLKFQAKAKQSSAKVELSGLYGAQKAFYAEYSTYHQNLPLIGYVSDGLSLDGTNCPTAISGGVRNYEVGFSAAGANNSIAAVPGLTVQCGTVGTAAIWVTRYPSTSGIAANPALAATTDTNAFTARAFGRIGQDATRQDQWTINQDKALTNVQSGI
jgi:type IV pilus assembly protein PilA